MYPIYQIYLLHYTNILEILTDSHFFKQEKGNLESDKDKLKTSLNKALVQNQQLHVDVETSNSRAAELKNHVCKLESSLEKVRQDRWKYSCVLSSPTPFRFIPLLTHKMQADS